MKENEECKIIIMKLVETWRDPLTLREIIMNYEL